MSCFPVSAVPWLQARSLGWPLAQATRPLRTELVAALDGAGVLQPPPHRHLLVGLSFQWDMEILILIHYPHRPHPDTGQEPSLPSGPRQVFRGWPPAQGDSTLGTAGAAGPERPTPPTLLHRWHPPSWARRGVTCTRHPTVRIRCLPFPPEVSHQQDHCYRGQCCLVTQPSFLPLSSFQGPAGEITRGHVLTRQGAGIYSSSAKGGHG